MFELGLKFQPPERVGPHPFEHAANRPEGLAAGAVEAVAALTADVDQPGLPSARSCSETAPKVTSGIEAWMSPAARSSRQTSRRISRRRGEAMAERAAVRSRL